MTDRRTEAFAALDGWQRSGVVPTVAEERRWMIVMRAALVEHRPDEYDRSFCRACHWPYHGNAPRCPAEQLAIDAVLGPVDE